jgi:transcriptional regulator with XRE-family HTH domain
MANAVKVHRVQISKYERDVAEPSWSVIQRLATVLGVTPNDFLADGEK